MAADAEQGSVCDVLQRNGAGVQIPPDKHQPVELFTQANWYNEAFNVRPATHVLVPRDGPSPRLGNRLGAVTRSAR